MFRKIATKTKPVPLATAGLRHFSASPLALSSAAAGGSPPPTSAASYDNHVKRVNIGKKVPELYQMQAKMADAAVKNMKKVGFSEGTTHLLQLRASQINQCAFCIRAHAKDAVRSASEAGGGGETLERVTLLSAWRETDNYYTAKEKAALELVEAVTNISVGQVSEEVYVRVASFLSEEEIAAVEWLAVCINGWNRIGIVSRYPVRV